MKNINTKNNWLSIALLNLVVVALLGFVLRCKILFSIPFLDYKNTLHAHSHFAFGGWVTIALSTLMVYEVLPKDRRDKPIYRKLLWVYWICAWGMLVSFLILGYAFFSILFSTLFIFNSYVFAWAFIKDINQSTVQANVKYLSVSALFYMIVSSIGPLTLAYMLANKSGNVILYKDAVYTYLHFQYNGYFTLSVFALFLNKLGTSFTEKDKLNMQWFSRFLNFSVITSLFLCFLWHYPNVYFRIAATAGAISIVLALYFFLKTITAVKNVLKTIQLSTRTVLALSFTAFGLKMILQVFTIFPEIGKAVFSNRPVIIGFLHLVLLVFISLYLLAHYLQVGTLKQNKLTYLTLSVFIISVMLNELTLMVQGLDIMFMQNSRMFSWVLLGASVGLFTGSILLVISALRSRKPHYYTHRLN
jgi:hypothetical protein